MNGKRAVRIDPADHVATLVEAASRGDTVTAHGTTAVATEAIEAGHKIALEPIPAGSAIVKYGEVVGIATQAIPAGAWVHIHNVASPPRGSAEASAANLLSKSAKPVTPHMSDTRTIPTQDATSDADVRAAERLVAGREAVLAEVSKVIVGQTEVIEQLLLALFSQGHCLFVGVPGLAKTLLVRTMAQVLDLHFSRIQFTPDLMPADITGTDIIQENTATGEREYRFVPGPIFANILLADEINRTPPKTQSALLQAMQELQVTAGGRTHTLDPPFFVLATQNPIEQEGTYPLPEAQLDRFMFSVYLDYPTEDEEMCIVSQTTSLHVPAPMTVLSGAEIVELQRVVRGVPVAEHVLSYAVRLARATRPEDPHAPDFVNEWITWGAGPRASQFLTLAAKARAIMDGRFTASREDVRIAALPVLRHRIIPSFAAEADGIAAADIVRRLLDTVPETA